MHVPGRGRPIRRTPHLALLAVAFLALVLGGCRIEPAENEELREARSAADLRSRVEAMLEASAEGWNAGELDAFMAVYADSPATTYVGGSGLRVGYEAIRERYAPLFRPGADRDSLRFEDLRIRALGPDVALGISRYVLHEGGEVTGSGPFTLVLSRVGDEWRIVHDHSSSDPAFVGGGTGDSVPDTAAGGGTSSP